MTLAAEALVLAHLKLVRTIAGRIAKRVPACVDMEELVAAGHLGLVEAASRYDAELHPNFAVYARLRIGGAMLDSVRGDKYPRKYIEMPEEWCSDGESLQQNGMAGKERELHTCLPPQLIDPAPSAEAKLIEHEEETRVVVCITEARRKLTRIEGRALDQSLQWQSMREVGAAQRKSPAWAHYTIHGAKKKLRRELQAIDDKKAA